MLLKSDPKNSEASKKVGCLMENISEGLIRVLCFLILFSMKKSLAIKLERSEKSASKKKLTTRFNGGDNALKNAKTSLRIDLSPHPRIPSEIGTSVVRQTTYRNKNLSVLPASLLNTLSELQTLDISHNKLTDSQIELLMNSCPKLQTLSIQGNLTNLIPAAIWKLKNLQKFRHDWMKLFPENIYEPEATLKNIKLVARKPNLVFKINQVMGINFQVYCKQIVKLEMNSALQDRVHNSNCSHFAQNEMFEAIRQAMIGKSDGTEEVMELTEERKKSLPLVAGCFTICGFGPDDEVRPKEQKWRQIPMKKQLSRTNKQKDDSNNEPETGIKIEKIRDISETEAGSDVSSTMLEAMDITYQHKDMPLHLLFSKFDSNLHGAIDIDRLLLKGYNPNTYDKNGLSAYHIVVIFRQEKGLERLVEISFKNPGFFDLEMPSLKEGRNILHFSVFLKDYAFTKRLIDFGFPIDKRDFSGARLIHLVDQNYEFLLLLRKSIKKRYNSNKNNPSFLTYPQPMMRKYTRHQPRVTQQASYQTVENKNNNLLQMFDAAVSLHGKTS